MDVWIGGFFTLASTIIGVVLTYYFTNKAAERANEIELKRRDKKYKDDLEQAREKYSHELEIVKLKNTAEIERLKAEFDAKAAFKQQQSTNQIAQELVEEALSGDPSRLEKMAQIASELGIKNDETVKKISQLTSQKSKQQRTQEIAQKRKGRKK